jgi:hypothetical protein
MSSRFLLVAGAVLLTAWATSVLTTTPSAAAKDDPAAKQKAKDDLKKELKDTKKYFVYYDLSYYVDAPKLKESRWVWKDPPPYSPISDKQGAEFYAEWVPTAGGEAGIRIVVEKMPHSETKGGQKSVFSHEFKSWGKTVPVSKVDDMAKGFYFDWMKESAEPIVASCHEPKKQSTGPADWYATAVATDKDEKKRVRKDWYLWISQTPAGACTWVATVTIADKFKDVEEVIQRVKDLMTNTVEIKDKRAQD